MAINEFGVGSTGQHVVVMLMRARLTAEQAINLAAWLVALAGTLDLDTSPADARARFDVLFNEAITS